MLEVADAAWIAAVPAALLTLLAIVFVGPWVGRTLVSDEHVRFWLLFTPEIHPEPVERGRYLTALAAPLLLAALTLAVVRLRPRWRPRAVDVLVVAIQAALVGFVVLCFLQQRDELLGPLYAASHAPDIQLRFFTPTTLLVALLGTVAIAAALGSTSWRARAQRWTRETRARQLAAGLAAVVAIAVWLLPGAFTEATIHTANPQVFYHVPFPLDETFAVLDGRTPLVNFAAQYGSLWPYLSAAGMALAGETVGVWVTLALIATGLGMLAIYALLRRASGSSFRALLLFLPLLATSFFLVRGPLVSRYTYGDYYGTFPIRYAGPAILAWLVARHLAGDRPRRAGTLLFAAGLVVLNNADVGVPALGAAIVALLWAGGRPTRIGLLRLAAEAAAGFLAAYALVAVLTLVRAGALPDLGVLMRFSRLFALAGFGLFAMPTIGLHLVLYLTFVVAFGAATVRALRDEPDRLLTGMLAWSAVFGLGAGAYFAGRSTPENLTAVFFPWALAIGLLLVPSVRALDVGWWRRRPPVAAIACLFAFLVLACSLAQTPVPWRQLERLRDAGAPVLAAPAGQTFVARHVRPHERAAILLSLGHRIAKNLDIVNVSPYANSLSMPTVEQWRETIADLRASGGRELFLPPTYTSEEMISLLESEGFTYGGQDGQLAELWIAPR